MVLMEEEEGLLAKVEKERAAERTARKDAVRLDLNDERAGLGDVDMVDSDSRLLVCVALFSGIVLMEVNAG